VCGCVPCVSTLKHSHFLLAARQLRRHQTHGFVPCTGTTAAISFWLLALCCPWLPCDSLETRAVRDWIMSLSSMQWSQPTVSRLGLRSRSFSQLEPKYHDTLRYAQVCHAPLELAITAINSHLCHAHASDRRHCSLGSGIRFANDAHLRCSFRLLRRSGIQSSNPVNHSIQFQVVSCPAIKPCPREGELNI
jgi:hypothetical protein